MNKRVASAGSFSVNKYFGRPPWRGLAFIVAILASERFSATLASAEPAQAVVEAFTIARDGDGILLPVFVGDQRYLFLVDTGFGCNIIDATLVARRQATGKNIRIGGSKKFPLYPTPDALVGDSRLPASTETGSLDLQEFRTVLGHDFFGILSMPFLEEYIVRIDSDRGRLELLTSVSGSDGEEFKLSYDRYDRPLLSVSLGGAEAIPFLIDTGSIGIGASLTVEKRIFDALNNASLLELREAPGRALRVEGNEMSREGWISELQLGRITHKCVVVSESRANTIGMSLLSRYVVTIDFPNDRLFLKPGRRIADADRLDVSGLRIVRINGSAEVYDVRDGSPADAAGLKRGDRIQTVNGIPSPDMSLFQIRSLLSIDGEEIRLHVESSRGSRDIVLQLPAEKNRSERK